MTKPIICVILMVVFVLGVLYTNSILKSSMVCKFVNLWCAILIVLQSGNRRVCEFEKSKLHMRL
ncbi:unnamed protein product [Brassica oleracea]